jgi:hypothetical protein
MCFRCGFRNPLCPSVKLSVPLFDPKSPVEPESADTRPRWIADSRAVAEGERTAENGPEPLKEDLS